MAAYNGLTEPKESEVVDSIKSSLRHEKYKLYKRTLNSYNQRDLGRVFTELDRVIENVIKAKYGSLQHRVKYEQGKLNPMLERSMERANCAINSRLTTSMSKLHPWVILV